MALFEAALAISGTSPVPSRPRTADGVSTPAERPRWFVISVFAAVAIVVVAVFYAYSLLPARPPPTDRLVFSDVTLVSGNASFTVQSESDGPYASNGLGLTLVVNEFPSATVGLGAPGSITRLTIGPNTYRITWLDPDGDSSLSIGDSFHVSGDGVPLPSISAYEFDLQWQGTWTAKAFWTTG